MLVQLDVLHLLQIYRRVRRSVCPSQLRDRISTGPGPMLLSTPFIKYPGELRPNGGPLRRKPWRPF